MPEELSDVSPDDTLLCGTELASDPVAGASVSGGSDVTAVKGGSDDVPSSPFIILSVSYTHLTLPTTPYV